MTVLSLCDVTSQSRASVVLRLVCNLIALAITFTTAFVFMKLTAAYSVLAPLIDPTLVMLCCVLYFVSITAILNVIYRYVSPPLRSAVSRNVAVSVGLIGYAVVTYLTIHVWA